MNIASRNAQNVATAIRQHVRKPPMLAGRGRYVCKRLQLGADCSVSGRCRCWSRLISPLDPPRSVLHIGEIEASDHSVLLHTLPQGKTVHLTRGRLEDIQAPVENDFPACIRADIAGMQNARLIEGPGEIDASAEL